MTFSEFVSLFPDAKKTPKDWRTRCPCHNGKTATSLSIAEGDGGRILLQCFGGCSTDSILSVMGLAFKDLMPEGEPKAQPIKYVYRSAEGAELMTVHRFPGKEFRQQAADGQWTIKHVPRVIYRFPEIRAAIARGDTIWIVEGEKDVENLARLGLEATCNAGGATKWKPEHTACLAGAKRVVVIADKDGPGRKHAEMVLGSLNGTPKLAIEVPIGKDASDWIAAGATRADFEKLIGVEIPPPMPLRGKAEDTPAEKPRRMRWKTLDKLCSEQPEEIPYLAPYTVLGGLTELDGYAKAGKTSLILAMVRAIVNGEPFLGQECVKGPVVYMSESPEVSLREGAMRAGIDGCADIHVVSFDECPTMKWADQVQEAVDKCHEIGANILIVDTFAQWANIKGDEENSAGHMQQAVTPLRQAAGGAFADGKKLAVWFARHTRKSGGEVGHAGRGSSSIAAMVDFIVQMEPVAGQNNTHTLTHKGRFSNGSMVIEYDEGAFNVVGTPADAARIEKDRLILAAVPSARFVTAKEMSTALRAQGERIALRTVQTALARLVGEKRLSRIGLGSRIDPYQFGRFTTDQGVLDCLGQDSRKEGVLRE